MEAAPKIPEDVDGSREDTEPAELRRKLEEAEAQNRELLERRKRELGIIKSVRDAALSRINHDPTTLLENRSMYDRYIQGIHRRVAQYKEHPEGSFPPISFIVIDIDRFKSVNDTYGHATGDEVLQSVSTIVRESLRAGDRVFRYGGEEIVIICEYTKGVDAEMLAERVRENIEGGMADLEVEAKNGKREKLPITVSCGVAEIDIATDDPVKDVFERADGAMYQAKDSGRNQVVRV